MSMTPDAKRQLSSTIRALRATLLDDLQGETERVYRLAIKANEAGLNQATLIKRQRLEAWLDEQVRSEAVRGKQQRTRDDFRRDVEKQAAYTLLNRLVFLRLLEAFEQRSPHVVTGGWNSLGYKNFREVAPALIRNDETEGYAFLLKLVFEDLAHDLPGLYGPAGMADLIPVPAKTLRALVDAFDDKELVSCWTDDMTLGWVYQYWNDPEREALDAKINGGGKIEPHEIASKTQMFTERYMVDWLLQNSLGPMWLAMCRKQGWTPEVEADGTLDRLEQRRIEWRAKRDAGIVSLTELMPLHTDAERRWAYYVPQPIPQDAIDHAPDSVRDLKILDPAVGSGHFLVVAFDLLLALYQEEARHRSVATSGSLVIDKPADLAHDTEGSHAGRVHHDRAIVERILEHNLHGIDLDPRAVQIAAAALWLKARLAAPQAQLKRVNLVASNLGISRLPDIDPSLVELRRAIEEETGIPGKLTMQIVDALRGADHLGSLLKIDTAIEAAIAEHERSLDWDQNANQLLLFPDGRIEQKPLPFPKERMQRDILGMLETFLGRHTSAQELGLRLAGEQLAAGVRFVRLVKEGTYDLVVANPPYQGTSKMVESKYVGIHYKLAKADLFAAFLQRGLQLVRKRGISAMLTMRNWMFIKQYSELRQNLLESFDVRALGDFAVGAFDEVPNDVLSVVVSVFRNATPCGVKSVAQQPTSPSDTSYDRQRTKRKRAATLCHVGRHAFDPVALKVVPEWPLVYWWNGNFISTFVAFPKIIDHCPARAGLQTANDPRFLRRPWEVRYCSADNDTWVPYVKGAEGRQWIEPLTITIRWVQRGLDIKIAEVNGKQAARPQNEPFFFRRGIAITTAGSEFAARAHSQLGIFGDKGRSMFPENVGSVVCSLNSRTSRETMAALNPTIDFTVGDVNRLPLIPVDGASLIFSTIEAAFEKHESHREASVAFKCPGPSPWRHAQEWAQTAVDRADGIPLPKYEPRLDTEPETDHVSFALGMALGRFKSNFEGIVEPSTDDLSLATPSGILFLDETLDTKDRRCGLMCTAAMILLKAWDVYGPSIAPKSSLRAFLCDRFFEAVHRKMYESRPIYWPLSSEKKTFVAWINIHRWDESTLRVLLADHLQPTLTRLEGELNDLRAARDGADKKAAKEAEKRFGEVIKFRDELAAFVAKVQQCAEKGPPPTDAACPPREVDARYDPDVDDGVMINSAALWPLLEPQWKEPKKWWKELATSKGKKDYDWSHLAMKYWPTRVDAKCQADPSLGVAHGCFWKYHPARAWAWELRLQDEIGPDFRIEEAPYRGDGGNVAHRTAFLRDQPQEALAAIEKEVLRRRRKQKTPQSSLSILEPGLWSAVPDLVWNLELALSKKQGLEFRLLAPDEKTARAKYAAAHPDLVKARQNLLSDMIAEEMFAEDEDEAADNAGDVDDGETEETDE